MAAPANFVGVCLDIGEQGFLQAFNLEVDTLVRVAIAIVVSTRPLHTNVPNILGALDLQFIVRMTSRAFLQLQL
jgi:hypothetical protein